MKRKRYPRTVRRKHPEEPFRLSELLERGEGERLLLATTDSNVRSPRQTVGFHGQAEEGFAGDRGWGLRDGNYHSCCSGSAVLDQKFQRPFG
ncbi:hypothetical protein CEXT_583011 [Caerostris extrusa]|uniref:Uncharacterized protein n=1 Tax=Caerostris extrusa TaxID=172846 RepID=A0AAV4TH75_CAEEX|nr:hypothetical protein CEXT_583011 [Caerostris extrusa]